MQSFNIFISSPGDVVQERFIAQRVIARLQGEFGGRVKLKPVLWEHEPVRATANFQEQILRPSDADVVVCCLWSRLGTRLPEGFERRPDGSSYESGTAFEFEDAQSSFQEKGVPDLLVYRKTAEPLVSLRDAEGLRLKEEQWKKLEGYLAHWFQNEDGSWKRGFKQFETADEFERLLETDLHSLIDDRLTVEQGNATEAIITWHRGTPFRGLEPFEFCHAAVFFGRTRAIGEIREALLSRAAVNRAFVLVFGMSGAGKSSLVRAGLLPVLSEPGVIEGIGLWRSCVFRPSDATDNLCSALAVRLADGGTLPELIEAGANVTEFAAALAHAPEQAILPLRMGLARAAENEAQRESLTRSPEARIAIVVDQMEELFTLDWVGHAEREEFFVALDALAQSGFAWIIATMRSDFYHRCAEHPRLAALTEGSGQYHLLPPTRPEIGQMIRDPARAAGLQFETDTRSGIGLDAVLEEAAARGPGALPLLEFTLEELYKRRSPARLMTLASYDALGGLEGAIGRRAEEVFSGLEASVREALPEAFTLLVTLDTDEEKPAAARRVPSSRFATNPDTNALVKALIDAHLLVSDRADGGQAVVGLAHEALLERWPRLREWIKLNREFLRSRSRVEEAALRWDQEKHDPVFLHAEGSPLAEAEDLLNHHREKLSSHVVAFLEASVAKARRKQLRLRGVAAGAMMLAIVATGGAVFGFRGMNEAREQAELALISQSKALSSLSRQLTNDGYATVGTLLALEALPRNSSTRPFVADAEAALVSALLDQRERNILDGHTDSVNRARFSPTGSDIVTASRDGTARVWNTSSGEAAAALKGHGGKIYWAEFSPDGKRVLTASSDKTARIWNAKTGDELLALLGHEGHIYQASFSFDGRYVITASGDHTARIWSTEDGEVRHVLGEHTDPVWSAAFSSDGTRAVTASEDHLARLWDTGTGKLLASLKGHEEQVFHAAFSPDPQSRRIVTASWDQTARLWDGLSGEPIAVLEGHKDGVSRTSFSADGKLVVSLSADTTVRVWDGQTGDSIAVLDGHKGNVHDAQFSPDGRFLATAAADGTVRLWDIMTRKAINIFRGHEGNVWSVDFSADGRHVVTASEDNTARIWNVELPIELIGHEGHVHQAIFSPTGHRLITVSDDSTARIWDVETGKTIHRLEGHSMAVWYTEFSVDGKTLVTTSTDGTARLWESATGRLIHTLSGHEGLVQHANISPDGRQVVTGAEKGNARVWDVSSGKVATSLPGHAGRISFAAFSHDGRRILTASEGTAHLWDTASNTLMARLEHEGPIVNAAFSPNDRRFVTASWDRTARIWDGANGKPVTVLNGHLDAVLFAAFSPDNRLVVTASSDRTARIWNAEDGELKSVLRGHDGEVNMASFSSDGRLIVTSSTDGTARLWHAASGLNVKVLKGHGAPVVSARFASTGRHVATASWDNTAKVWQLPVGTGDDWREVAKQSVPRDLTDDERQRYFVNE